MRRCRPAALGRVKPYRALPRKPLASPPMNLNYLIAVLCFIFWIVALVDCIKSSNPNKLLWIIVIILLPFLGTLLYFIFGKTQA